ncbi:hypothetical protein B0H19DRAFT_1159945 [Mycena capillaripes]|nr:hypothetical protein B0H19DRAFT_1159945 [Mycena capillaripes]
MDEHGVDETFISGYSSRSSTPADFTSSHSGLFLSAGSRSQSSFGGSCDAWSSPNELYTPNPFRYNNSKVLPHTLHQNMFDMECRHCAALKRENLVLKTENSTLQNAYSALLKVVGPALFLGQSVGNNVSAPTTALGYAAPAPPRPAMKQIDYPDVPFWHEHEYTAHLNENKGESTTDEPKLRGSRRAAQGMNVAMRYVSDRSGAIINGYRATKIMNRFTKLFNEMGLSGTAPAAWTKGSIELQKVFRADICQNYPEMELCADDWKVQYLAKKMYPGWSKTYKESGVVKSEPDDNPMAVAVKRRHAGESTTNKRSKLDIPPNPERDEDAENVGFAAPDAQQGGDLELATARGDLGDNSVIIVADIPAPLKIINPLLSGSLAKPTTEGTAPALTSLVAVPAATTTVSASASIGPTPLPVASAETGTSPVDVPAATTVVPASPTTAPSAKGTKASPGSSSTPR